MAFGADDASSAGDGSPSPSPSSPALCDSPPASAPGDATEHRPAGAEGLEPRRALHHRQVPGLHQVGGWLARSPPWTHPVQHATASPALLPPQARQRLIANTARLRSRGPSEQLGRCPGWLTAGGRAQVKGWLSAAEQGALLHFATAAGWLERPDTHNQASTWRRAALRTAAEG